MTDKVTPTQADKDCLFDILAARGLIYSPKHHQEWIEIIARHALQALKGPTNAG